MKLSDVGLLCCTMYCNSLCVLKNSTLQLYSLDIVHMSACVKVSSVTKCVYPCMYIFREKGCPAYEKESKSCWMCQKRIWIKYVCIKFCNWSICDKELFTTLCHCVLVVFNNCLCAYGCGMSGSGPSPSPPPPLSVEVHCGPPGDAGPLPFR